jgi:hypothetical protein
MPYETIKRHTHQQSKHMKTSKVLALGVMAAVLQIGSAAQASSVLFNNLPASEIGEGPVMAGNSYAQSFTTGAQSQTLESVTLAFMSGGPTDGGFAVHLYDATGSGSSPGSQLLTLDGNDNPVSGNFIYTGALALSPNTTYWVEADVNPSFDSAYGWFATGDAPAVGSGIGLANFAPPGPPGMPGPGGGDPTWSVYSDVNLQMQVNVNPTVVPEPSTWALVGSGFLGLILFRRRNS